MAADDFGVPLDEAIEMLPPGDRIHTFRSSRVALVGADWDRADLIAAMTEHGVSEAGPVARDFGHGLVLIDDVGPLFIETAEGADHAES